MTNNLQGKKSAIGPSVNENDTALIESIVTTRISSSTSSELNVELAKLKDNYMKTVNPITEKRASNFGIVNAHLIGFMEYDPKSGAASSHRLYSQRKSRSSSSNSWFHM